jgi:hypothetical protein
MKITIEIEIEVEGSYTPGDPGVYTYSNGDPGYPPTPPEFYITKVIWDNMDITSSLSSEDLNYIEEQMIEEAQNYKREYDPD